jgi:hypothetical protein
LATEDRYVRLGSQAILELLEREGAAPWMEIEARIADQKWGQLPYSIDPHILTKARRQLRDQGILATDVSVTRGGSEVPILYRTDLPRTETKRERAAARKRLLYARHQSWARSTPRLRQGLIGAGGEFVVHEGLLAASPLGFRLARPEGGGVSSLLGGPVPGGPLDNAAYLQTIDASGIPTTPVVLAVEVKNVRHWLYPSAVEIYQCLSKAAALKEAHPDVRILPVVVCRRRHYRTFQMGTDLGFFVIEYHQQVVLPDSSVDPNHLEEVRLGLGFADLIATKSPPPHWARYGPPLIPHFETLRDPTLRFDQRNTAMNAFRQDAAKLMGVDVDSLKW